MGPSSGAKLAMTRPSQMEWALKSIRAMLSLKATLRKARSMGSVGASRREEKCTKGPSYMIRCTEKACSNGLMDVSSMAHSTKAKK